MSQSNEEYWIRRKLADMARIYNSSESRIRMLKRDYTLAIKDIKKMLKDGNVKDYDKKRLKMLLKQIDERLQIIFELEEVYTWSALRYAYEEEYYRGIFNIQQAVGHGAGTYYIAPDMVEMAISTAWSGASYSDRIWKRKKELRKNVEEILRKGMLMGHSNGRMTKQLAERMDVSLRQAGRLIRTETCYVANQATLQSYKELEVDEYEFLATLDLKTSAACRALDGKRYPRKKAQVGLNYPPMHPHCRSTTIPVLEEIEGIEETRIAKDADGKYYKVPKSMKYEEWYEKYVKTDPRYVLEEKKIKNRYADEKQFVKYQEALGKHAPKTLEKFQEIKYNHSNSYKELTNLYKDVSWQLQAQKNLISDSVHKVPYTSTPNSVFDNYKDGIIESRRYYGRTGKPRLDIDLTAHDNPKTHPIVPHYHEWREKDGKIDRDKDHTQELTCLLYTSDAADD